MNKEINLNRRDFFRGAGAFAGASCLSASGVNSRSLVLGSEQEPPFRFVHLTDVHVQPELRAGEGWRTCVEKVNAMDPKPDFVITGGDLIMDSLVADADRIDLQWKLFDESLKNIDVPVHHVIGNRDVGGWSTKAKLSKEDRHYGKRTFAERYGRGRTYRSFDHKGWHFILLDSIGQADGSPNYIGLIDEEQQDWLKSDLEQTGTTTPIIMITHIPFHSVFPQWKSGTTTPIRASSLISNGHELHRLLAPYQIRLVLSGHGHVRERIEMAGVTHIQSGAVCGAWWKGIFHNNEEEAFGVVTCHPNSFEYEYVDYGWNA